MPEITDKQDLMNLLNFNEVELNAFSFVAAMPYITLTGIAIANNIWEIRSEKETSAITDALYELTKNNSTHTDILDIDEERISIDFLTSNIRTLLLTNIDKNDFVFGLKDLVNLYDSLEEYHNPSHLAMLRYVNALYYCTNYKHESMTPLKAVQEFEDRIKRGQLKDNEREHIDNPTLAILQQLLSIVE